MTAQQCIRARRRARQDKRYTGWRKDAIKRGLRLARQVEAEKHRKVLKKKT